MKKTHIIPMKSGNLVSGIGLGILTALIVSVTLTLGAASLVNGGKIGENMIGIVLLIRLISTFAGGLVGAGFCGNKVLPVIGSIWGGYLLILLMSGIILFDESFQGLGLGIISTVVGAVIALLIKLKPQSVSKKTVRYIK